MLKNISIKFCAATTMAALFLAGCGKGSDKNAVEAYTVTRGPLDISVLASGNVETARSTNILQRIGRTAKIVTIVPEGSMITEEDVKQQRLLVEFDSKDVEDQLYERQTAYENAVASAITAEETLAIQKSDNDSNIRTAELNVLYAESDLRKLVGDQLMQSFNNTQPADIAGLLNDSRLDGTAKLNLTTYISDIELAQTKLNRAEQKLEYTRKLYERQFVSKNDFENDQLDVQSQSKSLEATRGKYEIFRRFDFVKDFQKAWATWQEALRALERTKANAKIRLTTAESKHRTAKQALAQATKRLEETRSALANCRITATMTGMVVYAKLPRWDNTGPIQSGKEIRNQQVIFSLPDLSQMQVKVSINESQIDLLGNDMPAVIAIDALPGRSFTGKVSSKGILPSAENEWLNPDLKVYDVRVAFDNSSDILRPGMTATVEIIIEKLSNVVYVPIQSVTTDQDGVHSCWMMDGTRRVVTIGQRNRSFTVITSGLEAGEQIMMIPPAVSSTSTGQKGKGKGQGEVGKNHPAMEPQDAPPPPAAPASGEGDAGGAPQRRKPQGGPPRNGGAPGNPPANRPPQP